MIQDRTVHQPRRTIPSAFSISIFFVFGLLYLYNKNEYNILLKYAGISPYNHPFIDSEFMYAMKKCWLAGVNVYQAVPCDVVPGNKMAYSPLWPRLPFLPSDNRSTVVIAVATNLLLLGSISVFSNLRRFVDIFVLCTASISTMVIFAIERNNIDVWIFDGLFLSMLLIQRSGILKAAGYGLMTAAMLLKYYPAILFAVALKERPRTLLLITLAAASALAGFAAVFWSEIAQELHNIPGGSPFNDAVGLENGPRFAVMLITGKTADEAGGSSALGLAQRALLAAGIVTVAAVRARQPALQRALRAMGRRQALWLVFGCIVMGGCYAVGQSVGYRGIYLLPVVAGFLALARRSADAACGTSAFITACLCVAAMWAEGLRTSLPAAMRALHLGDALVLQMQVATWVGRELVWIVIETAMASVVFAWMAQTANARLLLRRLRRAFRSGGAPQRS